MENKYKMINRELVLKNQSFKGVINSLTSEITTLRQKELQMDQENRKLKEEIGKHEIFKKKLIEYSTVISTNLTKIIQLLCPQEYPNGIITNSLDMNEGSNYDENCAQNSFNSVSRFDTRAENNLYSEMNTTMQNKSSPSNSHINRRRKRRSSFLSTSPFDSNSGELGEIMLRRRSSSFTRRSRGSLGDIVSSPPRNHFYNISLEERDPQLEGLEDCGEGTSQDAIQSSPHRITTIIEEDEISSNCKSMDISKSTLTSRNIVQITNESNEVQEKSSFATALQIQKGNTVQSLIVSAVTTTAIAVTTPGETETAQESRITNDGLVGNITISNVPCSTPYNQSRKKCSINDNDNSFIDSSKFKCVQVRIKKLSLKEFDDVDTKMNSICTKKRKFNNDDDDDDDDDDNNDENKQEMKEQELKKENKPNKRKNTRNNKKSSRVNKKNSNESDNEINEKTADIKNIKKEDIENELILTTTERRTRSRGVSKCLAEPNLRTKLRR